MRVLFTFAVLAIAAPVAARAADAVALGAGSGVYAMAGAFLGQIASTAIGRKLARRAVHSHEVRCRAYRPPLNLSPEEDGE